MKGNSRIQFKSDIPYQLLIRCIQNKVRLSSFFVFISEGSNLFLDVDPISSYNFSVFITITIASVIAAKLGGKSLKVTF